jgi:DNA invertase Pin-like site-specific DNA recombinase
MWRREKRLHPLFGRIAVLGGERRHGRWAVGDVASIAEFEREFIRERVRSGLAAVRARGKRLGRPRCSVDVDRIAALRSDGWSWRAIARELRIGIGTARVAFLNVPRDGPL